MFFFDLINLHLNWPLCRGCERKGTQLSLKGYFCETEVTRKQLHFPPPGSSTGTRSHSLKPRVCVYNPLTTDLFKLHMNAAILLLKCGQGRIKQGLDKQMNKLELTCNLVVQVSNTVIQTYWVGKTAAIMYIRWATFLKTYLMRHFSASNAFYKYLVCRATPIVAGIVIYTAHAFPVGLTVWTAVRERLSVLTLPVSTTVQIRVHIL